MRTNARRLLGAFRSSIACAGSLQQSTSQVAAFQHLLSPIPDVPVSAQISCGHCVRHFSIQTQSTPNPSSLMFMPGKTVMQSGTHEFPNSTTRDSSPLAQRLFSVDGVSSLFFGPDFITVTMHDDAGYSWAQLKAEVGKAITDHFESGDPVFLHSAEAPDQVAEDDDDIVAMIKELLEKRIRPALNEDGGDIQFREWDPDSGIVTVKLMGACSGCPSSTVTLKSGIENMLKHYIPEVFGVIEADPDEYEKDGEKELRKLEARLNDATE